jgi:hypothetical protein
MPVLFRIPARIQLSWENYEKFADDENHEMLNFNKQINLENVGRSGAI